MKFAIGVARGEELVGVATAGRPVARCLDDGVTLEVTRSCTVGEPNANSKLYGAVWRAARAMGYVRLITYTQAGESGASLRAAGLIPVADLRPRPGWTTASRPRRSRGVDNVRRTRWEICVEVAGHFSLRVRRVIRLVCQLFQLVQLAEIDKVSQSYHECRGR